jgi:hypothetical protein
MAAIASIAELIPGCLAAAWVDARTGELVEHTGADAARAEELLGAAIELARTPARPAHSVMIGPDRVYYTGHATAPVRRILVVACDRSVSLGLGLAVVRAATTGAPAAAASGASAVPAAPAVAAVPAAS